jgi:hypothetical protein
MTTSMHFRATILLAGLLGMGVSTHAQVPELSEAERQPLRVTIESQEMFAVGFDKLAAFPYEIVDAATGATPEEIASSKGNDQVPDWIRLYDQQRVALTGYMLPLKVENGVATKFIMMRDITTCCYGNVPNMNEYVIVSMTTAGVKAIQDTPVVLVGVFKIQETYDEAGYLTSLFQMDGERFLGPKS